MSRWRQVTVDVDLDDLVAGLDDDLIELDLQRVGKSNNATERVRLAAYKGDLPGFVVAVEQMLAEQGVNLPTHRLQAPLRQAAAA